MRDFVELMAKVTLYACIFLFVAGGLVALGVAIAKNFLAQQQAFWAAWHTLAERHHLSFTGGGLFSRQRKLGGKYEGHPLSLETYQKGSDKSKQIYTRLTVSASQPPADLSLEEAVELLTPAALEGAWTENIEARPDGEAIQVHYEKSGVETELNYLQFLFDWLSRLADAYPAMVELGGQAVPRFQELRQNHALKPFITHLLQDIATDTARRWAAQADRLVCPTCLARGRSHRLWLGLFQWPSYYGCRLCHQSRDFYLVSTVIATLDEKTADGEAPYQAYQEGERLYVNWLARRSLFDFDAVKIIRASDEMVERFAVQVGNDTDSFRKPRYRGMRCTVSEEAGLSANTMRILEHTFGRVAGPVDRS